MKNVKLTSKEIRALDELLARGYKVCSSGCVFSEMTKSRKDCIDCEFTEAISSISVKLGLE